MSVKLKTDLDAGSPLKNSRHEIFAQALADGLTESDAYKKAYNAKPSVARANASRLIANASVRARVDWLKRQNAKISALSRERKREILATIAEDKKLDARARISAIQEDNRMTGDSADNVNIGGDGITINLGRFLDD